MNVFLEQIEAAVDFVELDHITLSESDDTAKKSGLFEKIKNNAKKIIVAIINMVNKVIRKLKELLFKLKKDVKVKVVKTAFTAGFDLKKSIGYFKNRLQVSNKINSVLDEVSAKKLRRVVAKDPSSLENSDNELFNAIKAGKDIGTIESELNYPERHSYPISDLIVVKQYESLSTAIIEQATSWEEEKLIQLKKIYAMIEKVREIENVDTNSKKINTLTSLSKDIANTVHIYERLATDVTTCYGSIKSAL